MRCCNKPDLKVRAGSGKKPGDRSSSGRCNPSPPPRLLASGVRIGGGEGLRGISHLIAIAHTLAIAVLLAVQVTAASTYAATNAPTATPIFHATLKSATEAAALDQSLVLLVFGADWCVPCKMLKAKTLTSKEFLEQGGALHAVEIDIDSEKTLARDYEVEAVPTLILQTPENKIVTRKTGFVYTAELLLWIKEARERVKQGKWEGTVPA